MQRIILILLLCLFCYTIKAQIGTDKIPYSWRESRGTAMTQLLPTVTFPPLDLKAINKEDLENEKLGSLFRFGFPHNVNLTLSNSGIWQTTSDGGRLWKLKIYSPSALSLNLLYDKFYLPNGGEFFIYSEDMKQHMGAFTSENNKGDRKNILGFATGLLFTNSIVLEYYEPENCRDSGIISISQVISGYRDIREIEENRNQSKSGSTGYFCHNDINCIEGLDYRKEKDAIACIVQGIHACSGALLNTTANDFRPVFLTAGHCLSPYVTPDQWVFYWNYEASSCSGMTSLSSTKSTTGANILALNDATDFMLLNLIENPIKNPNVFVYYLGWDRTTVSATSGVCIHHPNGVQKKISITDKEINSHPSSIYWTNGFSPVDSHWEVNFTNGTTESSSSGAPLLNQNKRVIGQLHGGSSGCPPYVVKFYGRFDLSWEGGGTSSTRLKDWLDPLNTEVETLDGIEGCPTVNFHNDTINTTQTVTGGNVNVQDITVTNGATLTIKAECDINVQGVTVQNNSKLILDAAGEVNIISDFEVESGSEFEIVYP